jgi:hypothetical protein
VLVDKTAFLVSILGLAESAFLVSILELAERNVSLVFLRELSRCQR